MLDAAKVQLFFVRSTATFANSIKLDYVSWYEFAIDGGPFLYIYCMCFPAIIFINYVT